MTDDDARRDEELMDELDAIDARLCDDNEAALRVGLAGLPVHGLAATLLGKHSAAVRARRAVVVGLPANEGLPRRLRHLDGLLASERDELAKVRERFAGTPDPAPDGMGQERVAAIVARGTLRRRIDHLAEQRTRWPQDETVSRPPPYPDPFGNQVSQTHNDDGGGREKVSAGRRRYHSPKVRAGVKLRWASGGGGGKGAAERIISRPSASKASLPLDCSTDSSLSFPASSMLKATIT